MEKTIKTTYSDLEYRQLIKDEVRQVVREELQALLNNEAGQVGANDQEGFININQAAEFLKVARQTLYTKTSAGSIPFTKKGKRLLFKKSELTAWLNNTEEKKETGGC